MKVVECVAYGCRMLWLCTISLSGHKKGGPKAPKHNKGDTFIKTLMNLLK